MRLLSIELAGYKRLKSDTVALFRMELVQKIQLILGGNGSGKSALLYELSPLPADGIYFHKGGYKLIRIEKNHNLYELRNDFQTKAGRHSFLKNGEELNQEGLQSTQLELVWNEFRINRKIRELLLGKRAFTNMRPQERREWLTMLADTDFEYAIDVHAQLKERLRDADRDVRRDQGRLTHETSKIITAEERERLQVEVKAIHEELTQLIAIRKPIEQSATQLESQQQIGLTKLNEMSLQLLRMRLHAPLTAYGAHDPSRNDWGELERVNFSSIADVDIHLAQLRERMAAESALINKAVIDHGKLQQNLTILKKAGQEGLTNLGETLKKLVGEREQILERRKYRFEFQDPQVSLAALDACFDTLFSIFSEIPQNEDKRFSQAARNALQVELTKDRELAHRYKNHLGKLEANAEHFEKHLSEGGVDCPKCGHHFVPGFTAAGLKEIRGKIEHGTGVHAEVDLRIKKNEETLGQLDQYGQLYRQYRGCVNAHPALGGLWQFLEDQSLPVDSPRSILPILTLVREDLLLELHAARLTQQINETKELMHQKTLVGDVSLSETQEKIDEVTHQVETMTSHLARLKTRYDDHVTYRTQLDEAFILGAKIEKLKNNLSELTVNLIDTVWMEMVHHCVRQLQSQLLRKEEALNEVKQQLARVEELKKSIEMAEKSKRALEILVDTMSPKDGMIAEGLMGFIRHFVKKMNQVIARVWTYPLVVKECAVGDDGRVELDYKFPMLVDGRVPVDDIEEGSGAQRDIVDLAFMIAGMKYLGLADAPLMLDEFEEHFDKVHQTRAVDTVKTLIDTQSFSQLLMISHFEATYTAYSNVDICVLDEKNIAVPDSYNQHVTIQ